MFLEYDQTRGTSVSYDFWNKWKGIFARRYIKAWVSNATGNELEKYKYLSESSSFDLL